MYFFFIKFNSFKLIRDFLRVKFKFCVIFTRCHFLNVLYIRLFHVIFESISVIILLTFHTNLNYLTSAILFKIYQFCLFFHINLSLKDLFVNGHHFFRKSDNNQSNLVLVVFLWHFIDFFFPMSLIWHFLWYFVAFLSI